MRNLHWFSLWCSIYKYIVIYIIKLKQFFLNFFTSPICCVSEFYLPMCGQEWGTVFFESWWAGAEVFGGIWIDGNIAYFAFSKVHFCTIFLSNFMSILFHSLMSLLCKHVISWCLLTKSMIFKSIVASFFTKCFVFLYINNNYTLCSCYVLLILVVL